MEIGDRVTDGAQLLRVLVGDVDVELLLELHHQLDDVQAVSPEILDEAGGIGELLTLDSELLLDDIANLLGVWRFGHGTSLLCGVSGEVRNLASGDWGCHITMPPSTTMTCPVM